MLLVQDSVTKLGPEARGAVVVAASHGGRYAAYLAAHAGVRGVILNDAAVGLDDAGISGLAYLDGCGMPAATISYRSARIGDGGDTIERGAISFVNGAAAALGCAPGQTARACAERMLSAPVLELTPPAYEEARTVLRQRDGEPRVIGIDSVSLARDEDVGQIVVTGSHGGVLGGRPESALRIDALAAVYNDAGVGIDDAGISRLPALAARGIAAATVAANSARIGEARSTWETGRLSAINAVAKNLGAREGSSVAEFADCVIAEMQLRR